MENRNLYTQMTTLVGRIKPTHLELLGTSFMVDNTGIFITPAHVIGDNHNGLALLAPHINNLNSYQDLSNDKAKAFEVDIIEIDPIRDLALLKVKKTYTIDRELPSIGSFDEVDVGESVGIYGFPHCTDGRRVFTYQQSIIGAKILLDSNGIKNKHVILNLQSRPGQSGSIVVSERLNKIVGVLIGTYAPSGPQIIIGNINPSELNQTTHSISAEYIKEMM